MNAQRYTKRHKHIKRYRKTKHGFAKARGGIDLNYWKSWFDSTISQSSIDPNSLQGTTDILDPTFFDSEEISQAFGFFSGPKIKNNDSWLLSYMLPQEYIQWFHKIINTMVERGKLYGSVILIMVFLHFFGHLIAPIFNLVLYKTGKGVVNATGYVASNTIWLRLTKKINSIGQYYNSFRFIYDIFSMQSMKALQTMLGYFNKGQYFRLLFMIKDMPLERLRRIIQNLTMTDMDKLFKSTTETLCNFDRGNCNNKQEIRNELSQLIEKSELIKPFIERLYQGIANYHDSHNKKWIQENNNLDWTCMEIGEDVFVDDVVVTNPLKQSYLNIVVLFFSFLKMVITIVYWISRYMYYEIKHKLMKPALEIEKDEKMVEQINKEKKTIDEEKLTLITKYYKTGEYIKILKLLNKKDIKKLITEQTKEFTDHRIYLVLNDMLSDMLKADRTIKTRAEGIRIFRCVLEIFLHSNDVVNTLFRKIKEYKEYLKTIPIENPQS